MKHVIAVLIKFFVVAFVLEIVLNILTALTFREILTISFTVTVLLYIIGDSLILPIFNNMVATFADVFLALITIYMYRNWPVFGIVSFGDALIGAVLLGVCEWTFHKYMITTVLPHRRSKKG